MAEGLGVKALATGRKGTALAVPETPLTRPDQIGTPSPGGRGRGVRGAAYGEGGASPAPTTTPALQHKPWTLPAQGLAVFHGAGNVARLSHYFLPRLLLEGKRVLFLDGANSADPRLLERFARERHVPFAEFNRGIQIARAFTCFQLTELIARVPKFLTDFPAEVVIVTAFPDLYFDEDVRDWNARVAFEQGLRGLRRCAGAEVRGSGYWVLGTGGEKASAGDWGLGTEAGKHPAPRTQYPEPCPNPESRIPNPADVAIAVFSAMQDFAPPPARRQFFPKLCAAANEVWRFSLDAENRLRLTCAQQALKKQLNH